MYGLQPVAHQPLWVAGENVAECLGFPSENQVERRTGEAYALRVERERAWKSNHAMADCGHGFYAYYSSDNALRSAYAYPVVTGVIEGYGETFIGTKGFRASKARVVALSVEPHLGIWRLEPSIVREISDVYQVPIFESSAAMAAEYPSADPRDYMDDQARAVYDAIPDWRR